MHFNALHSLTQPCMTAYCLCHNTYDPGILPGCANQCILGDMYLRSSLSRKQHLHVRQPAMARLLACRLDHLRNCTSVVSLCRVLFDTAFKHGKGSGTSYIGVYKCHEQLEMHGIPGVMRGHTCSSCNLFYDGGCFSKIVISHQDSITSFEQ